jgi:capsular exopolysaccharide synthesis family protein
LAQYDIDLRDSWRILRKRRLTVIIVATLIGVFSTLFAILKAPTPLYTSACRIIFQRDNVVEGLYDKTMSWSDVGNVDALIPRIKNYSVFEEVAKRLKLISKEAVKEGTPLKPNVIGIIDNLLSKVEVTRDSYATGDSHTNVVKIEVTDQDPAFAQQLANTIALTYKELHAEKQRKRATEAMKYIDQQLAAMRQKLRESEAEFNMFCQNNQLIAIDLQSENLLARDKEIQDEIRGLNKDKRQLEGVLLRLNQFLEQPSSTGRKFYTKKADIEYQTTNDTLVELLLTRDTLLEDYTLKHPQVVATSRKIIENARKMVMLLELNISDMESSEVSLQKELEEVSLRTNALVDKKLEFNRLKRKVESYTDITAHLEEKNQEALIRTAEKPEEISVLKPALLPTTPLNPPRTAATGILGVIIGLILGTVVAFVVETFDTSLGTIEDIEQTLGTKVQGIIPHADHKEILRRLKDQCPAEVQESFMKQAAYLISHLAPQSMTAENFRVLRTNFQFKCANNKIKTVAIVSASPHEGKTTIAINLAISLAQAELKVLLLGSDLRRPILSKAFGIDRAPGLTDVLLGNYPWRDAVRTFKDVMLGTMRLDDLVPTTPGLENLHIITSGAVPAYPAEVINSGRLVDFVQEAKEQYDIILFDSTPVLSTADATILGTKVDGVLVVYRMGSVSRGLLKRSVTLLEQINCNIMGTILNDMRPELSPDFHDYKYYRHYYSYGEEDKRESGGEHEKGLSFAKKRIGNHRKGNRGFSSNKEEVRVQQQDKRRSIFRLPLMGAVLALVTAGVLWQNGILERLGREDVIKPFVAKSTDSVENPRHGPKDPVPKSVPGAKDDTDSGMDTQTEKISSHPLSARLGSFSSLDRVRKAVVLVLSAYGTKIDFSQGVRRPVFAGHFEDPERAERFKHEHGLTKAAASEKEYANLIAIYTSPDELENQILLLRSLGYSPYVIKDDDGKPRRVFVGAYLTKAEAERQYNDLRSSGIRTQVVTRVPSSKGFRPLRTLKSD